MVCGSQSPNWKCVESKGEEILRFEVNLIAYSYSKVWMKIIDKGAQFIEKLINQSNYNE